MAFNEDFSVFIDPDTPGYKVMLVDYEPVAGIFDNDYVEDSFTESSTPVFWVKSSDIPYIEQGDFVTDEVAEIQYEVANVQPDGSGITLLKLRLK